MQALQEVVSKNNIFAEEDLLQTPVFKALLDLNILWKSKYYGRVGVEHDLYIAVVKDWIA